MGLKLYKRFIKTRPTDLMNCLERNSSLVIKILQTLLILIPVLCFVYEAFFQQCLNILWSFLLSSQVFRSVYFETWFTTFCYAILVRVPFVINCLEVFDKYKIHPSVTYVCLSWFQIFTDTVTYILPLATLDTFMVKKYCGVSPDVWELKRKSWIQTERALPNEVPTVRQVIFQIVVSIVLYDALFFIIHYNLHKNKWLYKTVHAVHHEHDVIQGHVTNQLTVSERIVLVLTANFALKVLDSHPLSRALFIPIFVQMLVENHSGYNFPWSMDKILPCGLLGGPAKHYAHHMQGNKYYQPFFTYLDNFIERKKT